MRPLPPRVAKVNHKFITNAKCTDQNQGSRGYVNSRLSVSPVTGKCLAFDESCTQCEVLKSTIESKDQIIKILVQDIDKLQQDILSMKELNSNSSSAGSWSEIVKRTKHCKTPPQQKVYHAINTHNQFAALANSNVTNQDSNCTPTAKQTRSPHPVTNLKQRREKTNTRRSLPNTVINIPSNIRRNGKNVLDLRGGATSRGLLTVNKKILSQDKPIKTKCVSIYADSHGKGIASSLVEKNLGYSITGYVKPSARSRDVVKGISTGTDESGKIVIICGSNDVAHNESVDIVSALLPLFRNNAEREFCVVGLPIRNDLSIESCVNVEICKVNSKL